MSSVTRPPWPHGGTQGAVVHRLDEVDTGVGEQGADDPRDEVGRELLEVRVDEADDVARRDEQGAPQDLALAGHGRDAGQDVVAVDDSRPGCRRDLGRPVGRAGVDDHDLVDERDLPHEVMTDDRDDVADRLLLVQRGQDDADRLAARSFRGHDPVERAVGHGPGAGAQPTLDFLQHGARLLCVHLAVRTALSTVLAFGYSLGQRW